MQTAVVILNWNGAGLLRQFLPSVVQTVHEDAVVVVADNGSTDNSVAILEQEFPTVRLCKLDKNYGFAEGYNRALQWVDHEIAPSIYVLLNSDVKTPEGWLAPLVERICSEENIGAVMPKLRSYREPEYFEYAGAAGGFIDGLGYPYCRGRILDQIEKDEGQYDTPCVIDWASGACLVVKSKTYWAVAGLEGRFFAHMEEIDLCWRMRRAGYVIFCEPRATVFHLGGGSLPNNSPRKIYLNFRNNLLMLRRNLPIGGRKRCIMTLRLCLDWAAALVFLLKGKPKLFIAVFRAHGSYFAMRRDFPFLQMRGSKVTHLGVVSILYQYYLCGRKRFSSLLRSGVKSSQSYE